MKVLFKYIKTTVIGGLLFLVPVVVVVLVAGKAMGVAMKISAPVSALIPFESVGGVAVASIVAVITMLLICFCSGLAAKKTFSRRIARSLEEKINLIYPRYAIIKAMTRPLHKDADQPRMIPVVARFDDNAQMAFEMERADGIVTVFLPGSPDPWSGTVLHMPEDRIVVMEAKMQDVTKIMKSLGRGACDIIPSGELVRAFKEAE
jgi:uncharacterized membrane protein